MIKTCQLYIIAYKIGIFSFLGFIPLSCWIYPQLKLKLIILHLLFSSCFFVALNLTNLISKKAAINLSSFSLIFAGLGISLACFISDGLSSFYSGTIFLIIILASVAIHYSPKRFAICILFILIQHFILNVLFHSWDLKNFLINLFLLFSGGIMGILVYTTVYKLISEIKTLEGFIPICARCKKIRDNKGYWNIMEQYIAARSGAEFTQSLCPECAKTNKND
jgi:hypothetical protein